MAIFFTADSHFWHRNIVDYCDRPYRTLDGQPDVMAMNKGMVENWNKLVGPKDIVYHLGDFGFGPPAKLIEARKQLNGKIILIKGNHDKKPDSWLAKGDEWHMSLMVGTAFMTHVPPVNAELYDKYIASSRVVVPKEATIILCGHVHEKWATQVYVSEGRARAVYNVGVDVWGMSPVSLTAIGGLAEAWEAKP
jgi:calcineurin-like phosphoesterase family protein